MPARGSVKDFASRDRLARIFGDIGTLGFLDFVRLLAHTVTMRRGMSGVDRPKASGGYGSWRIRPAPLHSAILST